MAAERWALSSSPVFGSLYAAMRLSKAAMSSPTIAVKRARSVSDSARTASSSATACSWPFFPMVTLQTMETSAAPMAPMIAAALPPPGVGAAPASCSRKSSRVPGDAKSAHHGFGDGVDLFRIQHQIVALEQAGDAFAMQSQFERAEAQGTEESFPMADETAIAHANPFDTRRRRRVGIGHQLERGAVLPRGGIEQHDTRRPGGEHDMRAVDRGGACGRRRCLDRLHSGAESCLNRIARRSRDLAFAAGDVDLRSFSCQQQRRPLTHRSGSAEHDGAFAGERSTVRQPRDGCRRGGVGTVRIEHDGYAELGEEFGPNRRQDGFALGQIAAPDENRGALL